MRFVLGLFVALLAIEARAFELPTITVHGSILSSTNEPIAGATVVLRGRDRGALGLQGTDHRCDILARAKTDSAGRFRFDKSPIPPRMVGLINRLQGPIQENYCGVEVIAWSKGQAVAWTDVTRNIERGSTDQPVSLVLQPEAEVTGVVRDEAGKPISQADVRIHGLSPGSGPLSSFLDRAGEWSLMSSELVLGSVSDAEGKFRLPNVPIGHRVVLSARAAVGERARFAVDTSPKPGVATITFESIISETIPLLRSPVELQLKSQRSIEVQVVDYEGKPVTTGVVQGYLNNYLRSVWRDHPVNSLGVAHVPITDRGKWTLVYVADARQPRLGGRVHLEVDLDRELPKVKIELPPSRWLEGKVVDESSGVGLPGAEVFYVGESVNHGQLDYFRSSAISGQKGRFRIPVAIGKGSLSASNQFYGYYMTNPGPDRPKPFPVEISDTGELPEAILALKRGLVVEGVVRDGDGKPVAGAMVMGINHGGPNLRRLVHSDAEGKYRLSGFSPRVELVVTVLHGAGAANFILPGDEKHMAGTERVIPRDLNLKTGVTLVGQVTTHGKPAANVLVKVRRNFSGDPRNVFDACAVRTNAEGQYRIPGFEPGTVFQLSFDTESGLGVIEWPYLHQTVVSKGPEMRLQRADLISYRQTLRGIVVDPEGKPVPGANVNAEWPSGDSLSANGDRPEPWTKSGSDGGFELTMLPSQPLQLMAYMPQPDGGLIRYINRVKPTLNQTDIRIVLDPKLLTEVEDLDAPVDRLNGSEAPAKRAE